MKGEIHSNIANIYKKEWNALKYNPKWMHQNDYLSPWARF